MCGVCDDDDGERKQVKRGSLDWLKTALRATCIGILENLPYIRGKLSAIWIKHGSETSTYNNDACRFSLTIVANDFLPLLKILLVEISSLLVGQLDPYPEHRCVPNAATYF